MNEHKGFDPLPPLTPLDEAQDLIYRAWEEPGKRERKKLARQALKLSADCADAYVILARDNTETLVEALIYYEAGVRVGERAIGEKMFAEEAGRYLGQAIKTNPHVPAYILGLKRIPKERPPYLDWGGEREAAYVASKVKHIWRREDGGIRWLRDNAS